MKTVEIGQIDLRYESFRLKDRYRERVLLSSVLEKGIIEPVSGIDGQDEKVILLDGFKRLRVARQLGISIIPYAPLAEDPVSAILHLIRLSNNKSLHILEQARLVDDLKNGYGLSVSEIAERLERSKAWVSVRLGILNEISLLVRQKIFSGDFPARAYLYTIRQFTRVNDIKKSEIDEFVAAVSGKKLSIRDIELLGRGFFQGNQELRKQIVQGNLSWSLKQLKNLITTSDKGSMQLNDFERGFIRDLEIIRKYMSRVKHKTRDPRLKSPAVFAEGNLLSGGVISQLNGFHKAIQEFYDRSRKA